MSALPNTSEFALAVEHLSKYAALSFMDFVAESKATADLDLLDAALRWLVKHGHARYDTADGVYNPEPSLQSIRDRLPNANVIPLLKS